MIDPLLPDAKDQYFPPEVANKVPDMFTKCLIIWAVLCSISIIGVRRSPEYANKKDEEPKDIEEEEDNEETSIGIWEGFISLRFWHMFLILFIGGIYC